MKSQIRIIVMSKNSKNIYQIGSNTSADYCKSLGSGDMNILSIAAKIMDGVDKDIYTPCPIKVCSTSYEN